MDSQVPPGQAHCDPQATLRNGRRQCRWPPIRLDAFLAKGVVGFGDAGWPHGPMVVACTRKLERVGAFMAIALGICTDKRSLVDTCWSGEALQLPCGGAVISQMAPVMQAGSQTIAAAKLDPRCEKSLAFVLRQCAWQSGHCGGLSIRLLQKLLVNSNVF